MSDRDRWVGVTFGLWLAIFARLGAVETEWFEEAGVLLGEQASPFLVAPMAAVADGVVHALPAVHAPLPDDWSYPPAALVDIRAGERSTLWQLPAGELIITDLMAGPEAVLYVAGYGSPALAERLQSAGLGADHLQQPDFSWHGRSLACPPEHHAEPRRDPRVDQAGVPVVLRLDRTSGEITHAVWLEGRQSAWYVPERIRETWFQPVLLAATDAGAVLVAHDGGYLGPPRGGPAWAAFYTANDWVSLLSPDLADRYWRHEIRYPEVDPAVINATQHASMHYQLNGQQPDLNWDLDTFSQPRTTALKVHGAHVYLAGWAPTRTSEEPWWCPYVLRLDVADGQRSPWRAWTAPPTLSPDGRLGGQVSDAAIAWLLPDHASDDLWVGTIGDGGNSVLRRAPADYTDRDSVAERWRGDLSFMRGRTLFWGGLARITTTEPQPALVSARSLGYHDDDARGRRTYQDGWISAAAWWGERLVVVGRGVPGWSDATQAQRRASDAFVSVLDANGRHLATRLLGAGYAPTNLVIVDDALTIAGHRHIVTRAANRRPSRHQQPWLWQVDLGAWLGD